MKLFDRYLATTVLTTFAVVATVMVALYSFFTFISELGDTGVGSYGALQAMEYVVLGVPQALNEIFPVVVLIGTLVGLGNLAAGSELVVLRAAGISIYRLTGAALHAGVVLAVVCFVLGNWVAPAGQQWAQQLKAEARTGKAGLFSGQSLWLRKNDYFVHVGRLLSPRRINNVTFYQVAPDQSLKRVLHVDAGKYADGQWHMRRVEVTRFSDDRVEVRHQSKMALSVGIKPDVLRLFVVQPQNLSMRGLYRYIQYRRASHLDSLRYQVAFWRKLANPVASLIMVLLAVPFVFGTLRSAGAGQRLFIGVLAGIAFYTLNEIVANTGVVYGLPALVTAWAPTLVLLVLAIWRLGRVP